MPELTQILPMVVLLLVISGFAGVLVGLLGVGARHLYRRGGWCIGGFGITVYCLAGNFWFFGFADSTFHCNV